MSFKKHEIATAIKTMESKGFSWNSDKKQMSNKDGDVFKINPSGWSVNLKGDKYTDLSGLNSSRHLK